MDWFTVSFSRAVDEKVRVFVRDASGHYAEASKRAIDFDWRTFKAWCDRNGHTPLPAAPETVGKFVEDEGRSRAVASTKRCLTHIAVLHKNINLPDPTKTLIVKSAVKELLRKKGSLQRQAYPIIDSLRKQMLSAAGDGLIDKRDKALLSVDCDTGCRRSEVVELLVEDLAHDEDGSATILIRRSKTDQGGEGQIRYISPASVRLLKAWLEAACIISGPIFRSVNRHGQVGGNLQRGEVSRIYKKMASKAKLTVAALLSSHGSRVGMVHDMVANNIELSAIMQAGGWKTSAMVSRYSARLWAKRGAAAQLAARLGRE